MMVATPKTVVAVAALLVLAAGLKVVRYAGAPGHATSDAGAFERVLAPLAHAGWTTTHPPAGRAGDLYTWIELGKPGCDGKLTIAVLGGGAEAAALVRLDHGDDVAFVQGGAIRAEPSGLRHQLAGVIRGGRRLLGLSRGIDFPLMAISPAPSDRVGECRGLTIAQWQGVLSDRRD